MGCGQTLAAFGHRLTCVLAGCPRPTAAAELLADPETEHVVELGPDSFTVRHPIRERLDDALLRCDLDHWIRTCDGPPYPPGRFRVKAVSGGQWLWLHAEEQHPTEEDR
jgi:hypothetical protein